MIIDKRPNVDNIISDVADMDKVQVMNALSTLQMHCRFCKRYFNRQMWDDVVDEASRII